MTEISQDATLTTTAHKCLGYRYDRLNDEIDILIEKYLKEYNYELKFKGNGWLKPYNKLKPFSNNLNINYNLPRNRSREKKQIFLLKQIA